MIYFLIVHFIIFLIFICYLPYSIRKDEKRNNIAKTKINKYSLFLITFLWEIIFVIGVIIKVLKIIIKTGLYFKKRAAF